MKNSTDSSVMSRAEFETLGVGFVAYIKQTTADGREVRSLDLKGIEASQVLFALYGADGTFLALTDTIQAASGHASEDGLEIALLH